ncbi:hypothetical protein GpSGHVEth137 [Glossina pallidipes salivary gland hypertrophy virus]|uniref:Uncharacterized protein n=1 Tax=Glossina hytrovirus (isolate Glossina pallidipes/Ethiopia/Seibersdorf/-) TaxID=379529 RepID=A0A0Y0KBN0_GHVS|nr:hypothetical protein GpSGHVEth137 [Glossina pallidipes salivary gland hypertrophy virus]
MEKKTYDNFLRQTTLKISCTYCNLKILINQYHKHIKILHNHTKENFQCIWCNNYTWKRGDNYNYIHRLDCLKQRIKADNDIQDNDTHEPETSSKESSLLFLNCNECHQFYLDNLKQAPYIPRNDVDSIYFGSQLPTDWSIVDNIMQLSDYNDDWLNVCKLKFNRHIGIDSRLPFAFTVLKETGTWFHCSIRFKVWDKIYMYLLNNPNIFIINNWCLCEALKNSLDEIHRHIIIYMNREYEPIFQKKITEIVKKHRVILKDDNFMKGKQTVRSRMCDSIKDITHFLNAVRYISYTRSICGNRDVVIPGNYHLNKSTLIKNSNSHYYINSPTVPHMKLLCMGLFPNSQEIITKILNSNKIVIEDMHKKVSLIDKTIQLQYLHNTRNHHLPYENVLIKLNTTKQPDLQDIVYLSTITGNIYFRMTQVAFSNTTLENFNKLQQESNDGLINIFNHVEVPLKKDQKSYLFELKKVEEEFSIVNKKLKQENVAMKRRIEELEKNISQVKKCQV